MTKTDNTQNPIRLSIGKNTCKECNMNFIVEEHELEMPGTKDLEPVHCPYCGRYNGEIFVNGIVFCKKIDE